MSNHLLTLPTFRNLDDEIVIRINLSYVKDEDELRRFFDNNHQIFLDYPKGRTKPPTPTMGYKQAIDIAKTHKNWKYFAVSNIESGQEVKKYMDLIPDRIQLVPKIETLKGVNNLQEILDCGIEIVMIDGEDLYTSCRDRAIFTEAEERVRSICRNNKAELLELYGVIFKGV